MKIAVASDHTGLANNSLYSVIKQFLQELGHEVVDFGPKELVPDDDYPQFMFGAANAVAYDDCETAIIMGGSGQGEAMAVNRVKGVRCTLFYGPVAPKTAIDAEGNTSSDGYEILRLSRQHNHANVLSLASRFLTVDEAKQAVKIWLETPYSTEERHIRRVKQLG